MGILKINIIIIIAAFLMAATSIPIEHGLFAHWQFNEGGGVCSFNKASNTLTAKLTNGAYFKNMQRGQSLFLDGVNDYVDIGDNDNLTFSNGASDYPFTISAWIYILNTNATSFRLCSKTSLPGLTGNEYLCGTTGANPGLYTLVIYSGGNTGSNIQISSTTSAASDVGKWVFITFTYNGSSSSSGMKMYRNGIQLATSVSTSGTYVAMTNTTSSFNIGRVFPSSGTTYASGNIQYFKIYKRELSATDIINEYVYTYNLINN